MSDTESRVEQLESSLSRMVEMFESMLDRTDVGSSFYDAATIREMNEAPAEAKALLRQEGSQSESCDWTLDMAEPWQTSCGEAFQFFEGGPSDNQFDFCPFCGKEIEATVTRDSTMGSTGASVTPADDQ